MSPKFRSKLALFSSLACVSIFLISISVIFNSKSVLALEQIVEEAPAPKVAAADTNSDGKPDQWQYYEDGQIARTEADTNFDGKVDEVGNFRGGKLFKIEKDSDYDGKVDKWVEY